MENLAVIELNESALKLSIYKTSSGRFKIIEEKSQPFKLAEEIMGEELLRPKTKNEMLEVLKIYRKMIETYKAKQIIAVASSFLQMARNYRGFIDEIYNNTGISFTIIQNDDTIKYNYHATVNSIDNSKGYLININAFKTNFIKYNRRTILSSATIDYGHINLAYDKDGKQRTFDQMVKLVSDSLKNMDILGELESESLFVGNGPAFVAFGRIARKVARYPLDIDNNYQMSKELIDKTCDFIKGIDTAKVLKIKGIDDMDAISLMSGSAIIKAFADATDAKEITISSASLREGIVHTNVSLPAQEKFNDLLANSIDNYYEFFKDEYSINPHVFSMAVILFKQLKVMHKLPRYYVKPLRIASYLYDSGVKINYTNNSKYGF